MLPLASLATVWGEPLRFVPKIRTHNLVRALERERESLWSQLDRDVIKPPYIKTPVSFDS